MIYSLFITESLYTTDSSIIIIMLFSPVSQLEKTKRFRGLLMGLAIPRDPDLSRILFGSFSFTFPIRPLLTNSFSLPTLMPLVCCRARGLHLILFSSIFFIRPRWSRVSSLLNKKKNESTLSQYLNVTQYRRQVT